MKSFDDKNIAENIKIIERPDNHKANELVGKTFEGTVKNVTDFGIFIRLIGAPDGLIHKSNLPNNFKANFKDIFTQGKKVRVKIEKMTEKGIQLKLIDVEFKVPPDAL
jgi:polyribonucleotide nucleotidyltransferase